MIHRYITGGQFVTADLSVKEKQALHATNYPSRSAFFSAKGNDNCVYSKNPCLQCEHQICLREEYGNGKQNKSNENSGPATDQAAPLGRAETRRDSQPLTPRGQGISRRLKSGREGGKSAS